MQIQTNRLNLSECRARVYHIETANEIKEEWFDKDNKVGITAGASTPDWIIKEVVLKMDELNKGENKQRLI